MGLVGLPRGLYGHVLKATEGCRCCKTVLSFTGGGGGGAELGERVARLRAE